jgi:hypothetical protein
MQDCFMPINKIKRKNFSSIMFRYSMSPQSHRQELMPTLRVIIYFLLYKANQQTHVPPMHHVINSITSLCIMFFRATTSVHFVK